MNRADRVSRRGHGLSREPADPVPSATLQPFKLGLFLLACAAGVLGTLIWIKAVQLPGQSKSYAAFFETSVGALRPGDAVRFKGLRVGQVKAIELARDNRSICVELEVERKFEVREDLVAEVAQVGLSGAQYLSLRQLESAPGRGQPPRALGCGLPAIPGEPGDLERMQAKLERVLDKFDRLDAQALGSKLERLLDRVDRIDIEALAASVLETSRTANEFLGSEDLGVTMANLRDLTTRMRKVLDEIKVQKLGPQAKQALDELAQTAKQLRRLTETLSAQLESLPPDEFKRLDSKLQDLLTQSQAFLHASNESLPSLLGSLQQGLSQMHATLTEAEGLLRSMRQQPSRILARPSQNEPFKK